MRFERVSVDGASGRLSVMRTVDARSGAPVVLVHPINSAALVWAEVADRLDRPVIALDLRGHGQSDQNGPFTVEDGYVSDVRSVLDALGVTRAHLGGGSLGGSICVALAATDPGRVLSVTTFGSTLGTGVPTEAIDAMVAELKAKGTVDYFADLTPQIVGAQHRASERVLSTVAQAVGNRPETVIAEILHGAFGADIRHLAGRVAVEPIPVLAAAGTEDPTCPPSMSEELASTTAGHLKVLPGLGHMPMVESPEQVSQILREHITTSESTSR